MIPPTLNLEETDIDYGFQLPKTACALGESEFVMSNSFGFGGVNVSLLLKKWQA